MVKRSSSGHCYRIIGRCKSLPAPSMASATSLSVTVYATCCGAPAGQLVRFVAVVHPTRGSWLLMSTDLSLSAMEIIRIYGLRFKIEHTFKQAVRQIGSFAYHFWMKHMVPLLHRNGNQYLHRQSARYRDQVRRKIHAYHVFMQAAVVA